MGRYSKKAGANPAAAGNASGSPDGQSLNHAHAAIGSWLKQVRFRRCLFGGVSEPDVWKKIGELNTMYEAALSAERARYDALLEAARADHTAGREKSGDESDE